MTNQKTGATTIETVVANGLCTGCGTCVSMCPKNAISLVRDDGLGVYLPKIDSSLCNRCSVCYQVCPGQNVDFKELSRKVSPQQSRMPHSNLLGNYVNCYVGYSNDPKIRFDSSSGGIVTQLLVFALEEGLIDGALVTRMHKDRPLEPEPFIARTPEEIVEASKSKYCPVPANIALREILENEGRYAVVGLPCHIHGLRKAQKINKKLDDRVVMAIGLFCSHNDSFVSTEYLLNRFKVNQNNVKSISYRGKGWPGILQIEQKKGNTIECPFHDWVRQHEYCFFTPNRCLVCCDHAAELADLAAGDAWLPEFLEDQIGTSIILSRNERNDKIVKMAELKNRLTLKKICSTDVVKSQGMMRFKKNGFAVRRLMFRLTGRKIPTCTGIFRARFLDYPRSGIIILNRCLGSNRLFWSVIKNFSLLQKPLKRLHMAVLSEERT